MSEDYAKGFKDGFAAGLEEGKKINDKTYTDGFIEGMKKTLPPPYIPPIPPPGPNWILEVKEYCPKCGIKISGVMGYVCRAIDCPTGMGGVSYTIGSTDIGKPVTGRVDHTPGFNNSGFSGPNFIGPDDNSVWVNGSWVSLGS